MNYSYKLVEIYKETKGYSQDKQAAMDIPKLSKGVLANIKAGTRHLTAEQALFIANESGLNVEEVIINLGIEKSKSEEEKSVYESLAKKIKAAGHSAAMLLLAAGLVLGIAQNEPEGSLCTQ
ncbi:hypothetical protein [Pseudoalteromonas ruthenica]|uniref:hypothetical protein n=1 Tax=Pseudoalteromonas ruthenica TaxID=151081 RepID=UPI00241D930F|nr:hypothetical protein [Pseudoalteromonas ruthenica]|tara:strand:- start:10066 stop:10431 length:366 start_codon:yes stop_codon:yes gene_type:complete